MALSDVIEARDRRRFGAALFAQHPILSLPDLEEDESIISVQISHAASNLRLASTSLLRTVLTIDEAYSTSGVQVVSAATLEETDWSTWLISAKELLQRATGATQNYSCVIESTPSAAAKVRVARLTAIQAAFGFPAVTLAEILKVSRPALYKWLDAEQDTTLRPENQRRLALIEMLAAKWRARSNAPLSSVAHEPVAQGRTVLDFLKDEPMDENSVKAAFERLVKKIPERPRTPSQRMAEAGFKR